MSAFDDQIYNQNCYWCFEIYTAYNPDVFFLHGDIQNLGQWYYEEHYLTLITAPQVKGWLIP